MKHVLPLAVLVAGCGGGGSGDSSATGTPTGTEAFAGAPLAEPSDGACPTIAKSGEVTFTSGGVERSAILRFPKDPPPGLPVLFWWHGLGDSAAGIDGALDLESYARQNDVIVVVPDSAASMLMTWNISTGGDDAVFYDDLRTCVVQELGADISRITTTGFSFGALFSTWLVLNRGDTLAAALTFSGGTDPAIGLPYAAPGGPVPVVVAWGGDTDLFDAGVLVVDFQAASQDFSSGLLADGHTVANCDHGLGHNLPFDFDDAMTPWLLEHRYGEPSPFAGGLDAGFPAYCSLAGR